MFLLSAIAYHGVTDFVKGWRRNIYECWVSLYRIPGFTLWR
jgi:hypothetical protein